jgi:multidrug efflux pump subunit AcrA (membrane-fusion protein)
MTSATTNEPFRFAPAGLGQTASEDDGMMRETRRELRRLVAEISSLCNSRVAVDRFWPKFLSLVGTAMAADGGVIWRRRERGWESLTHCGAIDRRLVGSSAHGAVSRAHALMVEEVGDCGGPVMVPPGADWDSPEPGNPTEMLAGMVPIPVDPDQPVEWMIELFLPPGGGPATQRGYLRFVAQMADLAAQYMRAERLRIASRMVDFNTRSTRLLVDLQQRGGAAGFTRYLVDGLATLTGAERVSLVQRGSRGLRVEAVSGTNTVDQYSEFVRQIAEVAGEVSGPVGLTIAADETCADEACADEALRNDDLRPDDGSLAAGTGVASAGNANRDVAESDGESGASAAESVHQTGDLVLRGILVLDSRGERRIVIEDRHPITVPEDEIACWRPLAKQLDFLLRTTRFGNTGRNRQWRRFGSLELGSPLRTALTPLGLLATVAIACMIPIPLVVKGTGYVQPQKTQIVYAPRRAVVDRLMVDHGQLVQAGDVLAELVDDELQSHLQGLVNQLAILKQQLNSLRDERSRTGNREPDQLEKLVLEQSSVEQEIRGIEVQIDIARRNRQSLTLTADRSGRVDAWQIEDRMRGRPVDYGQALMRIIPENSPWRIIANIPEDRLDLLVASRDRLRRDARDVSANVVMTAFPDRSITARLQELGPVQPAAAGAGESAVVSATFAISATDLPDQQPGAPVEIAIPCGVRPLAFVVGLDLIRMTTRAAHLYW